MSTRPTNKGEASFTLLETIIALGLLTYLLLSVGGVQGNSIYFHQYGREVTVASWLARGVMAQVEKLASEHSFSDIKEVDETGKFADHPEYTYRVQIKDWKLPLLDLIAPGGSDGDPMAQAIKEAAKAALGDELLKTAEVEVLWSEGAKQNSATLAYLMTNQAKVDELIGTMKDVFEAQRRAGADKGGAPTPAPSPTPNSDGG